MKNPDNDDEKAAEDEDVLALTKQFLEALWLLPRSDELDESNGFKQAFTGPPQSVALIEAGATALSKWWAAGLGGSVAVLWASVAKWWSGQENPTQVSVIWAAAIASAAAVIALGYIIGSDVRGRSLATVASIDARIAMARALIRAAEGPGTSLDSGSGPHLVPLSPPLVVESISKEGSDETGWVAVALQSDGEAVTKYLLSKGKEHEWVAADQVKVAALAEAKPRHVEA